MAFWLRSEERRVAARARRVERDLAEVARARTRFVRGLSADLARPKVLLGLFAVGLGYGWLRPSGKTQAVARDEDDEHVSEGRVASLIAAALAGARIYQQVRRAATWIGSDVRPSAAPVQNPSDPVQQYQADDGYDTGQQQLS